MNRFICAEAGGVGTIVLWVVLILVLVVMLVLPMITQRKRNKEYMQMIDSIRVGDTVRTAGGVIGRVTKIMDKGEIKTVILETGSKAEKSYMEFDIQMIGAVLKSTRVEEDADRQEDSPKAAEPEQTAEKNSEKPVAAEQQIEEGKAKTASRKPRTSVKKTTKK